MQSPSKPGLYEIINIVNGKKYIGSSVDINRRWIEHRTKLKCNRHRNKHLQNSYKKHGVNSFVFRVLALVEPEEAIRLENVLLASGKYEYNIAESAIAPNLGKTGKLCPSYGRKHTEEELVKMSEAQVGEKNHNYGKTGKLASWYGKSHSEEEKRKISLAQVKEKNHQWIHFENEQIEEMKSLRNHGKTYKEIGKAFGVSRKVVRDRILEISRAKYEVT